MICPKCNFEQPDGRYECFKCGVIFEKLKEHRQESPAKTPGRTPPPAQTIVENNEEGTREFVRELFLFVKSDINPFYFGGRILIYVTIFSLGWKFILTPMEVIDTGKKVLHMVNLPFHEAGHILFRPFGEFMTGIGGSLMQLLVPLLCLMVFLIKYRDTFSASITLWWLGESFMDLAPYINDARLRKMILLGGITGRDNPDFHDWHHILRDLGMLQYDHALAEAAHAIGIVLMIMTFVWGGYLLFKQFKNLDL